MATNTVNFYLDKLGINLSGFRVYYDFNSNNNIPSIEYGDPQFSGQLAFEGDFFEKAGSGQFTSGNYIQISNADQITNKNFTIVMIYEKSGIEDNILFSSYQTGLYQDYNVYQGFNIGTNTANKLYFESYDANGPLIKTFSPILAQKNLIAVTYNNSYLSFYVYDFDNEKFNGETTQVNSNYIFSSDKWYVGASPNAPYTCGSPFSGYMDEFLYFDRALQSYELNVLASGFYTNSGADVTAVNVLLPITITGYVSQNLYKSIPASGFTVTQTGVLTDNCGNTLPLYATSEQTGILVGSRLIPLYNSGYITTYVTGSLITDDILFKLSFGYDKVSLLCPNDNNDIKDIYVNNIENSLNVNLLASYDLTRNMFNGNVLLDNTTYSSGDINLYSNGLGQIYGGYYITGIYSPVTVLLEDYFITGAYINSTGNFDNQDTIIFDNITGYLDISRYNYTSGDVIINGNINNIWFLNGQKLLSGIEYDARSGIANFFYSGDNLVFPQEKNLLSGLETIFSFPHDTNLTSLISISPVNSFNKFSKGSSLVWMNGVRQKLNADYCESSKVDLIEGSFQQNLLSQILQETDGFWE